MRYLGLDVGNKRIGVAVASTELRLATPLRVIERKSVVADAACLNELVREYDADAVVVGLPHNADGTESEQERRTRTFVAELQMHMQLPIHFQDERFSTTMALAMQRERGVSEKQGRVRVDASAAAVILQEFMDNQGR